MTNRNKGGTRPKQGANASAIAGVANANAAKIKELTRKLDNLSAQKKKKGQGGSSFASLVGKAGSAVGTALGAGISRIAGFGDYTVMDNTMSRGGYSSIDVPMFGGNGNSEVRVTHREFVKTISVPHGGADFNNFTMDINPSNSVMFPWLSKIAKNYQQYKVNGMVFTFKSMTSEYTSSGSLGTVGIATNYNVNDKPFTDLVSFENSQFAVVNKPSLNIIHAIECREFARNGLQLYVRDANNESSQVSDARFYDFAKVQVMTDGLPQEPGTTLGQLWVSYDVTLLKPVISRGGDVPPSIARTVLRSQKNTTALQWLDNGDIYSDTITWPSQPVTANAEFKPFDTSSSLSIVSGKVDTFSRTPTDLTLIAPSDVGGLTLRRNGHYKLVYSMEGAFANGQYILTQGANVSAFYITPLGTATHTMVYDRPYSVSHAVRDDASSVAVVPCGMGVLEIIVSGIVGGGTTPSGGIQIDLNPWTSWHDQAGLPNSVKHTVQVQWSDHATSPA